MMRSETIVEEAGHRWIVLGRDPELRSDVIDTNELVLQTPDGVALMDPGGLEIFPAVLSELSRHVRLEDIKVIVATHQDPDIVSSLPMWLDLCPNVKVYAPWMWTKFLSHFCMGRESAIEAIPDEGMRISIGGGHSTLTAVPAHFCHSSGNYSFFDEKTRVLFSGDIGAALLPEDHDALFVDDFAGHIRFMDGFHRRWMPSTAALHDWARRARDLRPSLIAPQHGALFRGENVEKFLSWLESIEVGFQPQRRAEAA